MELPTRQKATDLLSELDQELAKSQGRSARPSRVGSTDLRTSNRSASPYRALSPLPKASSEDLALALLDRVKTHKVHFAQQCEQLESRLRALRSRV